MKQSTTGETYAEEVQAAVTAVEDIEKLWCSAVCSPGLYVTKDNIGLWFDISSQPTVCHCFLVKEMGNCLLIALLPLHNAYISNVGLQ